MSISCDHNDEVEACFAKSNELGRVGFMSDVPGDTYVVNLTHLSNSEVMISPIDWHEAFFV